MLSLNRKISPTPTLPQREGDSPSMGGGWGEASGRLRKSETKTMVSEK